ncbi:ice-binding family protein [Herbiconiux sp. P17]|uniref:ice-binding family protein n=1 Tax=Herbiconiux wuyangfengii TaxID=3342794 RepID=UPI0035B739F7
MRSRTTARLHTSDQKRRHSRAIAGGGAIALGAVVLLASAQSASAIGTTVNLGTAASYSVLGGQSVTNTGPSLLGAGVGVSPGSAITGFPPGLALGATHSADAASLQAQSDLTTAYNATAAQAVDTNISGDLGNLTLLPGVYNAASSIGLTGAVTLNGQGDPNAVFIFQIGSGLTTATSSSVVPINGARACNVFWQVGESATIGSSTSFVGTIMALTTITFGSGATVDGRALARNGSVTLNNNVFTDGQCDATTPTSPPPSSPPPSSPPPSSPPATPPGEGPGGTGGPGAEGTPGPGVGGPGAPGGPGTGGPGGPGTSGGPGGPGTGGGGSGSGTFGSGGGGFYNTGSLADTGFEITPLATAAGVTALLGLALLASAAIRRPKRRV